MLSAVSNSKRAHLI